MKLNVDDGLTETPSLCLLFHAYAVHLPASPSANLSPCLLFNYSSNKARNKASLVSTRGSAVGTCTNRLLRQKPSFKRIRNQAAREKLTAHKACPGLWCNLPRRHGGHRSLFDWRTCAGVAGRGLRAVDHFVCVCLTCLRKSQTQPALLRATLFLPAPPYPSISYTPQTSARNRTFLLPSERQSVTILCNLLSPFLPSHSILVTFWLLFSRSSSIFPGV